MVVAVENTTTHPLDAASTTFDIIDLHPVYRYAAEDASDLVQNPLFKPNKNKISSSIFKFSCLLAIFRGEK